MAAFMLAMGGLYSACAPAGSQDNATAASISIQRQGDRLTAQVSRTPLRLVLIELRRQAGIHGQLLDPADEDMVSESFRDTPLPEAIARLLNGRSFVIYRDGPTRDEATDATRLQLVILPRTHAAAPIARPSDEQDSTSIDDLAQAMVDPDEKTRIRAQILFEQALVNKPAVPSAPGPTPVVSK